ncbi:unnamed protein product (macronuclear) [Paramecium tetraurelia]|uniref:Uncharacterized protein n=1 Tax=Paramecium tetraurelia TaxID=5888 RepID=A0BHV6_PARTE|nr:uncharacterized protein GSPATT00029159001 [Paramecium tetraurelia]CAK58123.1 unnamed protein product [Paramecium tetraurelia]|eukprot:XP_001425521.1 hypothetical protein (macronuclear) [Paramecium tetraurelia strain d4-2]
MKFSRSTSTHLTNLSFRSNPLTTIQTPQSNSRLTEVNSKIDDLLKKSQTTFTKPEIKHQQQDKKLTQTHSYALILEQIQREKKQLLTILLQKDGIIREQQNKITQLDLQNKSLMKQLTQFNNLQPQMEKLEEQCQLIIKDNEQLKYEKNQIQTSLNYLKCQNLQIISNEIRNSLQQLHQQIKKHYLTNYKDDYYNLQLSRMSLKINDLDFYTILRDCLDSILYMIKNTDNSIENLIIKNVKP